VGNRAELRCLTSINRTIELLRHMLNWAAGRDYLEKTPFRRGTETLIKKLRKDNLRRRRLSTDEELRLLAAAPAHLRPMIITALDTGMRRGEMLALRFAEVDFTRGLITLRGETTKSKKTRLVPISTQRCALCSNGYASMLTANRNQKIRSSSAMRLASRRRTSTMCGCGRC
jgi:integrase